MNNPPFGGLRINASGFVNKQGGYCYVVEI